MKLKLLNSMLCLCLLLPACNNQQENAKQENDKQINVKSTNNANDTSEHPVPVAPPEAQKGPSAVNQQNASTSSGKVLETMNSGGDTYLLLDTGKVKQWVAIPETSVKIGEELSCKDGMEMPNFTSKTLNRTFESLIFSTGVAGKTPSTSPSNTGDMAQGNDVPDPNLVKPETGKSARKDSFSNAVQAEGSSSPTGKTQIESGGSVGAMAPAADIKVEKAAGENSHTVAEIFADNTNLDGKTVRIQGKAVKFNPNIMGKNWLHIQDGSGDSLKNTHDLVITTNAIPPKDNAIITIEGIVRANKDFGAGYSYVALIEEAKIIP